MGHTFAMKETLDRILKFLLGDEEAGGARDLSDSRITQALIRLERFADLGRMTASLAHDLRTPLHVAASAAETLAAHRNNTSAESEELELIIRNSRLAAERLEALLDFAKTGKASMRRESLETVLQKTALLWEKQCLRQKIKVKRKWGKTAPFLMDSGRIQGVLYNILGNAIEAMPEGGTLSLQTGSAGDRWLTVRDTGSGMDPATLNKISTPFFTTKENGTGLGLYLARQVLLEHGAKLSFHSRKGRGTKVRIGFALT